MGDEAGGIGLITSLIGGLIRGAEVGAGAVRAAAPVIRQGVVSGIRFADPRRLAPLVTQIKQGPLFRPLPIIEKTIEKTPIIKSLPEWARGYLGISTSPAGIAGGFATDYAAGMLLNKFIKNIQEKPAAAAAQPELSSETTSPRPTAGPRVDTSTPQEIIRQEPPRQSPRVVPVTPIQPPDTSVSPAAITAAQTGLEAPGSVPLAEFYRAQKQLGSQLEQTGELQKRLQQTGMVGDALMDWVKAHPDLAYRELLRREKRPTPSVD